MRQETQFRFKNNFSPGAILESTSSSTPGHQQPSKYSYLQVSEPPRETEKNKVQNSGISKQPGKHKIRNNESLAIIFIKYTTV